MVTLCHLGASLRCGMRHAMEGEFDFCLNPRDFALQRDSTSRGHAARVYGNYTLTI